MGNALCCSAVYPTAQNEYDSDHENILVPVVPVSADLGSPQPEAAAPRSSSPLSSQVQETVRPTRSAEPDQGDLAAAPAASIHCASLSATEQRLAVIRGAFLVSGAAAGALDDRLWRSPRWKLQVFVSSTFTDTGLERDILMQQIQPALRKRGRARGVEATLVDMRWGVRDENTLDHRTWIDCWVELERCRAESRGLFFLSLQSDK